MNEVVQSVCVMHQQLRRNVVIVGKRDVFIFSTFDTKRFGPMNLISIILLTQMLLQLFETQI